MEVGPEALRTPRHIAQPTEATWMLETLAFKEAREKGLV